VLETTSRPDDTHFARVTSTLLVKKQPGLRFGTLVIGQLGGDGQTGSALVGEAGLGPKGAGNVDELGSNF
jgi:hypothetical protein